MTNRTFTPAEIETIQIKIMALLCYVKTHDRRTMPRCFQFCEKIIRNINACRDVCYAQIDELTALIKSDWRSACEIHAGLPAYYMPSDNAEIMTSMNRAIAAQISEIDELIDER